jgi:hypothetical protein
MEVLFVAESEADGAYAAAQQLMQGWALEQQAQQEQQEQQAQQQEQGQEQQQEQQGRAGALHRALPGGRSVRLLAAGPSSSCSQKIHK